MKFKKLLMFSLTLILLFTTTFLVSASPSTPTYHQVYAQYANFISAIESGSTTGYALASSYPDFYAGAYYGTDGLLHINTTESIQGTIYDSVTDDALTVNHIVTYSLNELRAARDTLRPKRVEFDIISMAISQDDNQLIITTNNELAVTEIIAFMAENQIDQGMYSIEVVNGSISPSTSISPAQLPFSASTSTLSTSNYTYVRPGDVLYNWDYGYPRTWATVLCNAQKSINGSTVYGFVTAGHLWWDTAQVGTANSVIAQSSAATTDYSVDATFIPFNSAQYGVTSLISNSIYSSTQTYHLQYYYSSVSQVLENSSCTAFGKTTGISNITIIDTDCEFYYVIPNTTTQITLNGIQTTGYTQAGDSGGPVATLNEYGTYTLLGMTSGSLYENNIAVVSYIIPVCSIFSALDISMMGGTG